MPTGGPGGLTGQGCAPQQATQFNMEHFSGMHNWYACSHARPTFCNVCREALPGVTSHGLSCEGQRRGPAGGVGWGALSEAGLLQEGCGVMATGCGDSTVTSSGGVGDQGCASHGDCPRCSPAPPPPRSLQVQGTQALRRQSHQQLQVDDPGFHRHRNH